MRIARILLIVCTSTALSGCALQNKNMQDNALSSTEEVAATQYNFTKKIAKAKPSSSFELQRCADFSSPVKGIYISQATVENRAYLQYLIAQAKETGINTFVIDLERVSNAYEKNIILVKNSGLRYVARVVVFPSGGNLEKVQSEAYWMTRYRLVDAAIGLGADEIQLDYIRYAANNTASLSNAKDIHKVISWFKEKIGDRAKLQIDVFGGVSFNKSLNVGQNIPTFASSIDACCPTMYPSQFEQFKDHAKKPYDMIYSALITIKSQFDGKTPFALYPYIELSNHRQTFTNVEC